MASEPFSIVSVVEDVIQKHGSEFNDIDFASKIRKSEEACKYLISSIPFIFFEIFSLHC
jgi:hypothetical protein